MDRPKTSKYNICLPIAEKDGKWLIFNGVNGAVNLVNGQLGQLLDSADRNGRILPPMDEKTFNFLMFHGYLDPRMQPEDIKLDQICNSLHQNSCKHVVMSIAPTLFCNFNCDYCFEKSLREKESRRLGTVMSKQMVDAVFSQMDAFRAEGKYIDQFIFFGGEPFLPGTKDIVKYTCQKCQDAGIPMQVITNGYYLDEFLDIIAQYHFTAVKITIDGPREIHDARRSPPGEKRSFDRIVANTLAALKTGKLVTFRTNINRENMDVINRMKEEYEKLGLTAFPNFQYYFCATMDSFERAENSVSNVDVMKKIGSACADFAYNSAYARMHRRLVAYMEGKRFENLRCAFCVAHSGKYTVDPFGNVYTCWDLMHHPDAIVAKLDVDQGRFVYNENHEKWTQRTVNRLEKCRECKYAMFCGGGCAAQSLESQGCMDAAFCDSFPEIFNQVAVQIARERLL